MNGNYTKCASKSRQGLT